MAFRRFFSLGFFEPSYLIILYGYPLVQFDLRNDGILIEIGIIFIGLLLYD